MKREESRYLLTDTFDNWQEFVEHAKEGIPDDSAGIREKFNGVSTKQEALDLAINGWPEGMQDASRISEEALQLVEQQVAVTRYETQWLLAGAEVDIGKYLSGIPENMIEYEPFITSTAGKVVTVCVSVGALSKFNVNQIIRRGANVLGLIRALEETQHSVEVWLDSTIVKDYEHMGTKGRVRVLLKGANDSVDPEVITFALGHPASLRVMCFGARLIWPSEWRRRLDCTGYGDSMGASVDPIEDLPDGTIYLPCLGQGRSRDVLGGEFVKEKMVELGLIKEEETY